MTQDAPPKSKRGGARPGAGRPKKQPELVDVPLPTDDPLKFMLAVMGSAAVDIKVRLTAANNAAPFFHQKIAPAAKKEKPKAGDGDNPFAKRSAAPGKAE